MALTPEEKLYAKYEKSKTFLVGFTPPEVKLLKAWFHGKRLASIAEARDAAQAWTKLDLAAFHIIFVNVDLHENSALLARMVDSNRFVSTPVFVFSKSPAVYKNSYAKRRMRGYFCRLPVNINEVEKNVLDLFKEGKFEKSQIGMLSGAIQHYSLGCKALERRDFDAAKEDLRQALKADPEFVDGYLKMAQVLTAQKNFDTALAVLDKAHKLAPEDSRVWYLAGIANLERGRNDMAMQLFTKAVGQEPKNINLIMDIGNAFLEKNMIEEALHFFDMARTQSPDFIYAYNRIGIALSRAGRFDEAEASYNHALTLDDKDPGVYFNLGMMHMRKNTLPKAAEFFKRSLDLDSEMTEAKEMLDKIAQGAG